MIFDEKCLFFPIKADYYTFLLFLSKYGNEVPTVDYFSLLKFTFMIIKFFHGILEVENLEISLLKKNICP
jgi:hypothetical protein